MVEAKETENPATFNLLCETLTKQGISHKITEHDPVKTSEEAAKIRGATLESGAKAMLLKYEVKKGEFQVFF